MPIAGSSWCIDGNDRSAEGHLSDRGSHGTRAVGRSVAPETLDRRGAPADCRAPRSERRADGLPQDADGFLREARLISRGDRSDLLRRLRRIGREDGDDLRGLADGLFGAVMEIM